MTWKLYHISGKALPPPPQHHSRGPAMDIPIFSSHLPCLQLHAVLWFQWRQSPHSPLHRGTFSAFTAPSGRSWSTSNQTYRGKFSFKADCSDSFLHLTNVYWVLLPLDTQPGQNVTQMLAAVSQACTPSIFGQGCTPHSHTSYIHIHTYITLPKPP